MLPNLYPPPRNPSPPETALQLALLERSKAKEEPDLVIAMSPWMRQAARQKYFPLSRHSITTLFVGLSNGNVFDEEEGRDGKVLWWKRR